jgi:hypothetical protein
MRQVWCKHTIFQKCAPSTNPTHISNTWLPTPHPHVPAMITPNGIVKGKLSTHRANSAKLAGMYKRKDRHGGNECKSQHTFALEPALELLHTRAAKVASFKATKKNGTTALAYASSHC